MRKLKYIPVLIILLFTLTLTSCATVFVMTRKPVATCYSISSSNDRRILGGTRFDVLLIGDIFKAKTSGFDTLFGTLAILDLLPIFIVDVLILPVTVTWEGFDYFQKPSCGKVE